VRQRPGGLLRAIFGQCVIDTDGKRDREVVPLAPALQQPSELLATDVEEPEECRVALANVLDDHEMEAVGIGESRLDLPSLQPQVSAAGRAAVSLHFDEPVAFDVGKRTLPACVFGLAAGGTLTVERWTPRDLLDSQ